MEPVSDAAMARWRDGEMARWLHAIIPRSRQRAALAGMLHSIPDGFGEVLYRR